MKKRHVLLIAVIVSILTNTAQFLLTRPRIFIFRDYPAESMQGDCRIIDYMVNGVSASAIIYGYEDGVYEKFIKELQKVGRITQ